MAVVNFCPRRDLDDIRDAREVRIAIFLQLGLKFRLGEKAEEYSTGC
jgi:hypothetical protein